MFEDHRRFLVIELRILNEVLNRKHVGVCAVTPPACRGRLSSTSSVEEDGE